MVRHGRRRFGFLVAALLAAGISSPAFAAKCGNNAGGFNTWIGQFKAEAASQGVSQRTLDKAFRNVRYATKTISLDRNQHSFKLSLQQFMAKRGANTIISRGKKLKRSNARLFNAIEKRYGVPPGPLIAIWGMESGFGSFMGNQHTMSAVSTLAVRPISLTSSMRSSASSSAAGSARTSRARPMARSARPSSCRAT